MKNLLNISTIFFCFLTMLNYGCTKDFLDAKPSSSIVQPTTLDEFQKILDNYYIINQGPALGILASDEYIFISDATWLSARTSTERNSYIWASDLYEGETSEHWNASYSAIFYANNVLAGLEKIDVTPLNNVKWGRTKGWALFVRSFAYYQLVNNFAPFYDSKTALIDLGVPLRLKPSIDELLPRSTVQQTFDRIFTDLTQALTLLDSNMPTGRTRPSKAAAHALFARIYLNQREYAKAELHADSCLQLYDKLIDYNTLSKTSISPFTYNHPEQIYLVNAPPQSAYDASTTNNYIQISSELINLYSPNDLRLSIFFLKRPDNTYAMKRGYVGPTLRPFLGLATDEIYLIKAECLARRGEIDAAMIKLNQLIIKRWNPKASNPEKPYQNIAANNTDEAISKILLERRKELVWRVSRWDDLKRLNKEGYNITLTRTVNRETYTLLPNSAKYVFPIPQNEINISGIQQNLR